MAAYRPLATAPRGQRQEVAGAAEGHHAGGPTPKGRRLDGSDAAAGMRWPAKEGAPRPEPTAENAQKEKPAPQELDPIILIKITRMPSSVATKAV